MTQSAGEATRAQERRARILAVAERHFSEQPYDAVSTVAIATEAGVNRGWIHHEFGTKKDLYVEILRRIVRVPVLPTMPATIDPAEMEESLRRATDVWLAEVERRPAAYLAAQRVSAGFVVDAEVQRFLDELREGAIDRALVALFPSPEDAPPALRGMAAALGGLMGEALVEWLDRRRLTREQVLALVVHMTMSLVAGVGPVLAAGEG